MRDIDNMKVGEIKEITAMFGSGLNPSLFKVGEKWLFRLVTYHVIGRIVKISGNQYELEDVSWVADSGRFGKAIAAGELDEVERVEARVIINADTIIDAYFWTHDLPRETK